MWAYEAKPEVKPAPRALEALGLLSTGMTRVQAARAMGITENTIKNHLSYLFTRMGAGSAIECYRKCVERGYIEVDRC